MHSEGVNSYKQKHYYESKPADHSSAYYTEEYYESQALENGRVSVPKFTGQAAHPPQVNLGGKSGGWKGPKGRAKSPIKWS